MSRSAIHRLQNWYQAQCDEDWEHSNGLDIGTLDNPGFTLSVNLTGTNLEAFPFSTLEIQREEEQDWLHCRLEEGKFRGFCGPQNLEEMLLVFLDWADSAPA